MPSEASCDSYLSLRKELKSARVPHGRWSTVNKLLSARCHAGESRRRSQLDEALKLELLEEDVLGLDPPDGGGELVRKELDEAGKTNAHQSQLIEQNGRSDSHGVSKLVAALRLAPLLLVPVLEDLGQTRRHSLVVDLLGVRLGDLVRLGGQVGDVATDEEVGVEVSQVDLLREVCE